MLFNYNTVNDIPRLIRENNSESQAIEAIAMEDVHKDVVRTYYNEYMTHLQCEDFDIMPMPDDEITEFILTRDEENQINEYIKDSYNIVNDDKAPKNVMPFFKEYRI